MKKLFFSFAFMLGLGISASYAQETKVEPVTTVGDKVHNVIHPKHKRAHGYKVKHKYANGDKRKVKVQTEKATPMVKEKE